MEMRLRAERRLGLLIAELQAEGTLSEAQSSAGVPNSHTTTLKQLGINARAALGRRCVRDRGCTPRPETGAGSHAS